MTEIAFPSVTICSQGLNMEIVAKAVERDFYKWHTESLKEGEDMDGEGNGNGNKDSNKDALQQKMELYLREKFDIGVPVKYKAFCEKYHDEVKMDNIHPEYDDVEWLKVEEQSI